MNEKIKVNFFDTKTSEYILEKKNSKRERKNKKIRVQKQNKQLLLPFFFIPLIYYNFKTFFIVYQENNDGDEHGFVVLPLVVS